MAWAVAEGASAPDTVIFDHYEAFPYEPAARTSPAESKVPQAFSPIGDRQEESEATGERHCNIAAMQEAPLSIYRGRSRFSTTPDDQDKPESVAQRCTHLQRADKVGAVLPRSDSDCKVRRQAQDSSEVVLATGEVQHYSQQYKQAAARAMLAHVSEAGGQEDRHRTDLPTRLQVLQRHATTAPTTAMDREET